jgi:transcriptional regulator with XRE-family HTH domain
LSDQLYNRVREARSLTGLSQERFAEAIGVSRGAVAQWEMREGTAPSVDNLIKIAKLSGIAFEYLATGRGERVLGQPRVSAEPEAYRAQLDPEIKAIFDIVSAMPRRQRRSLLELLKSPLLGGRN